MKDFYLKLAECYKNLADVYRRAAESITAEKTEESPKAKSEEKPVTIDEVRKILAEKTQSGKSGNVIALIKKYGAVKLSDINPEHFEALLKEAEGL